MYQPIALVAGASRGAGKGIALALAEIGATIYIIGRTTEKNQTNPELGNIDQTAREVNALGGKGIPVSCDCSDEKEIKQLISKIEKDYGYLDILVNSAWGAHDVELPIEQFFKNPNINWMYMFEKGVKNYLMISCYAIPLLQKGNKPLITNISFWDEDKYTGSFYYDLSKNTMNRMVLAFHHELAKDGIASIALSPGYMKTERVLEALRKDPSLAEKFGVPNETTRYVGRAVVALYHDPDKMNKSGKIFRVGDLARSYGFTDLDGTQPKAFRLP